MTLTRRGTRTITVKPAEPADVSRNMPCDISEIKGMKRPELLTFFRKVNKCRVANGKARISMAGTNEAIIDRYVEAVNG